MKTPRPADWIRMSAIAVVYILSARVGLTLDAVGGFATVVWAPTGIALAGMLLFGTVVAPGVFVGALVANMLTGAPLLPALGIGAGNTLEALVGAWGLRRISSFRADLDRLGDALGLFAAALIAPFVSASIGVGVLLASGIVERAQALEAWTAWWVGDCIGALMVTPLILVWRRWPAVDGWTRVVEAIALLSSVALISWLIFFEHPLLDEESILQPYAIFPLMIWASVRFGQRGAITAAFVTTIIALLGTVNGTGPFVGVALHDSLVAVQAFMGVTAACFLVLGAAISERENMRRDALKALEGEARANRAKADFIAVMSHELRTPLGAIGGHVDLLLNETNGHLTPRQRESLDSIQRVQSHVTTLVDDVLNYSRLEAGPIVMHTAIVRVNDMFDSVEPVMQPEFRRKRLALDRHSLERGLVVLADPERLRQVLLNLLTNAVKYTPDGGTVALAAERESGRVRIRVKDSGIGIPEEDLKRVFEPFFQVDRGRGARLPGVGLGLTIARDLTRAMNGEMAIESSSGTGTTVSIILPAG